MLRSYQSILDADGNPAESPFKTPQRGAATQSCAPATPRLGDHGGVYCAAKVRQEFATKEKAKKASPPATKTAKKAA